MPVLRNNGETSILIMGNNTKTLIDTLQNAESLDGRFCRIEVMNRDPDTGMRKSEHQGSLSVVFRAHDLHSGNDVVLKFFDPDYQGFGARYRMNLFEREADLLSRFVERPRFLQLVKPLCEIEISVSQADGNSIAVSCGYFAMEWLDGDITEYFLRQQDYDALVKLSLFRQIVLGVFALHGASVAHRDIKYDNLRHVTRSGREMVIPIDLGTAIDLTSNPITTPSEYQNPVGASAFAPIESQLGLAGIRKIAIRADTYALGCLLHDLFNIDYFFVRLLHDPGFLSCFGACKAHMTAVLSRNPDEDRILVELAHILDLTRNQVTLPQIDGNGTSVPNAARDQLNRLLHNLTDVHYGRRESNVDRILRMIDSATRSLKNELLDHHRRRQRRIRRERRARRLYRQKARLEGVVAEGILRSPAC